MPDYLCYAVLSIFEYSHDISMIFCNVTQTLAQNTEHCRCLSLQPGKQQEFSIKISYDV